MTERLFLPTNLPITDVFTVNHFDHSGRLNVISVASIAIVATAAGAFAFKNSGNTFVKNGTQCVQDLSCSSGSGGTQCTGTHLSKTTCTTQLQAFNTHTVND